MANTQTLMAKVYSAFNQRDIDGSALPEPKDASTHKLLVPHISSAF